MVFWERLRNTKHLLRTQNFKKATGESDSTAALRYTQKNPQADGRATSSTSRGLACRI